MSQQNYYQLLHVSPQATAQEIKVAYRKLAFKYHPDRNNGSQLTEGVLKEINEAYDVLSNPEKRKFYNASIAVSTQHSRRKHTVPVTSQTILQDATRLRMFVEKTNVFTINQDVLFFKIQALLADYHLNILLLENNTHFIHQFIQQVLRCMQPLAFSNMQPHFLQLQKLAVDNEALQREIHTFYVHKKRDAFWHNYKMIIVLFITLLLCLLMYFL